MITGAHAILYSTDADADRAFIRDVLGFNHLDVGGGWLIFALPPAEVAVHPGEKNDVHELYLMTDDVNGLIAELQAKNIECSPVSEQGWGSLTRVTLPSGSKLGVYQPKHASPSYSAKKKSAAKRPAPKKPVKKKIPAKAKKRR
jgi:hypothetical protein